MHSLRNPHRPLQEPPGRDAQNDLDMARDCIAKLEMAAIEMIRATPDCCDALQSAEEMGKFHPLTGIFREPGRSCGVDGQSNGDADVTALDPRHT